MHVLQDVGHSVANTEKKRRLGFFIVNHTLKKYVYYLFFFFFPLKKRICINTGVLRNSED